LTEDGTPGTLSEMRGKDFAHLLEDIDGYLCELTGAQIRGGLHILGQLPTQGQLTDLLFSLCRLPNLGMPSIREAVAIAAGAGPAPIGTNAMGDGRQGQAQPLQHETALGADERL